MSFVLRIWWDTVYERESEKCSIQNPISTSICISTDTTTERLNTSWERWGAEIQFRRDRRRSNFKRWTFSLNINKSELNRSARMFTLYTEVSYCDEFGEFTFHPYADRVCYWNKSWTSRLIQYRSFFVLSRPWVLISARKPAILSGSVIFLSPSTQTGIEFLPYTYQFIIH